MRSVLVLFLVVIAGLTWLLVSGGARQDATAVPATLVAAGDVAEAEEGGSRVATAGGGLPVRTEGNASLQRDRVPAASGASVAADTLSKDTFKEGRWLLRGFVIDSNRRPIVGAEVTVRSREWSSGMRAGDKTQTDSEGRFGVVCWDPRIRVTAQVPHGGRSDDIAIDAPVPDAEWPVVDAELMVHDRAALSGIVRDADGQPLEGASVRAVPNPAKLKNGTRAASSERVLSDIDGRFELLLPAGRSYVVRARRDRVETVAVYVDVVANVMSSVELVMPGAIGVSGLVLLPDGRPASGGEVLTWLDGPRGATRIKVKSEDDGTFKLVLPTFGDYLLVAKGKKGLRAGLIPVHLGAAQPRVRLTLQLVQPHKLHGRVVNEGGKPMAGFEVFGVAQRSPGGSQAQRMLEIEVAGVADSVRTAPDGSFTLAVAPDHTYGVAAKGFDGPQPIEGWVHNVPAGTDSIEIEVRAKSGAVIGRVKCDDAPKKSPAYRVELIFQEGDVAHTEDPFAEIHGSLFRLPPRMPGERFWIRVVPSDSGYAPCRSEQYVVGKGRSGLSFKLQPWANVPIRIVDADGSPIVGRQVTLQQGGPLGHRATGATDRAGRITLQAVPGSTKLFVASEDGDVELTGLAAVPGANAEVARRLR